MAIGLLIPFLGTSLGAACVFFMRKALSQTIQKALSGFAAGVMVAASIWSLLIPAIGFPRRRSGNRNAGRLPDRARHQPGVLRETESAPGRRIGTVTNSEREEMI